MTEVTAAAHDARRRRALCLPVIGAVTAVVMTVALAVGLSLTLGSGGEEDAPTLKHAQSSYDSGDFAAAEAAASSVVTEDAEEADALLLLARSLSAQGKNDDALEQYAAIVEGDPKNHEAMYEMASIEQLIGRTQEAITHLEAAVALEQDADYLTALAPLYATVGRWVDCVTTWQQYLQVAQVDEAGRAEAHAAMAGAYENAREYDKAKDALNQALSLDPDNATYKVRLEAYGS